MGFADDRCSGAFGVDAFGGCQVHHKIRHHNHRAIRRELAANFRLTVGTHDLDVDAFGAELAEKIVVELTAVAALETARYGRGGGVRARQCVRSAEHLHGFAVLALAEIVKRDALRAAGCESLISQIEHQRALRRIKQERACARRS